MGVWAPGPGGTAGDDTFTGDGTNETADGLAGNDSLSGGGGDDTLNGGTGVDALSGGDGNDLLIWNVSLLPGDQMGDVFDGGDGVDVVELRGDVSLQNLPGLLPFTGIEGISFGGDAVVQVIGMNDAQARALASDSILRGSSHNDMLVILMSGTAALDLSGWTLQSWGASDVVQIGGSNQNDSAIGTSGGDTIFGELGADTLNGVGGNDTLNGGDGNDTLIGGLGFDTINGGVGNDLFIINEGDMGGAETYDGGAGTDTIRFAGTSAAQSFNFIVSVVSGIERLEFASTTGGYAEAVFFTNNIGTLPSNLEVVGSSIQNIVTMAPFSAASGLSVNLSGYVLTNWGSNDLFQLIGNDNPDNVTGTSAYDYIDGGGGNDTLNGGGGNDTIIGNLGVDTVNGGAGNDSVNYFLGDGNGVMDGGADSDFLAVHDGAGAGILNVTWNGSGLTVVSGNSVTNIEAISANLGGGVDWLIYNATEAVTVNLFAATASGFSSINNVERVVGGSGDDSLSGNASDNRLDGAGGNDSLSGGGGIDTLIGGDGDDAIEGASGNDSINGGAGDDTISWIVGDNRDTINGGADSDTFNATGLGAAELGNATWNGTVLTALMDNGLSNIEAVNLDLGGGVDWLIYNATAAVVVNLSTNSASGFASISNIEKVIGGSGNDTLTGNGLDNRLDGQGGGDTLDGGAGADAVLGGDGADVIHASAGNDSLQGQNGNDTFHWVSTDGRDTFNGGADTDTVNLTGAAVADVADANWNGSVITGLLNNALVSIEAINLDLGDGGSGGDWLRYNSSFGVSVDLGAGTATGFASITGVENLIGGTGGDSLTGNGGINKINGNNGDDVITGAGGNDNLTGGAGSDTFVYAAGAGNDTIVDFDAWVVGGQDFLDVSAFGINAGNFAARVAIIDTGADTVVRIDNTYFITLKNVTGDGDNVITDADFILGP
jgi:Ca2+-binding RTX toxin-like protein